MTQRDDIVNSERTRMEQHIGTVLVGVVLALVAWGGITLHSLDGSAASKEDVSALAVEVAKLRERAIQRSQIDELISVISNMRESLAGLKGEIDVVNEKLAQATSDRYRGSEATRDREIYDLKLKSASTRLEALEREVEAMRAVIPAASAPDKNR